MRTTIAVLVAMLAAATATAQELSALADSACMANTEGLPKAAQKLVRLRCEAELAKAEGDIKVAKAETSAEVERLKHEGEQHRQDREVARDNSRDDHRPVVAGYGTGGYVSRPYYLPRGHQPARQTPR